MPGIESISFIVKFPHGSQAVGTSMLGKTLKLTSMWQIVPIEDELFSDGMRKRNQRNHPRFHGAGDIDSKQPQYLRMCIYVYIYMIYTYIYILQKARLPVKVPLNQSTIQSHVCLMNHKF